MSLLAITLPHPMRTAATFGREFSRGLRTEWDAIEADPERLQRVFQQSVQVTLYAGKAPLVVVCAG